MQTKLYSDTCARARTYIRTRTRTRAHRTCLSQSGKPTIWSRVTPSRANSECRSAPHELLVSTSWPSGRTLSPPTTVMSYWAFATGLCALSTHLNLTGLKGAVTHHSYWKQLTTFDAIIICLYSWQYIYSSNLSFIAQIYFLSRYCSLLPITRADM